MARIVHFGKFHPSTAGGMESYAWECLQMQSQWSWVNKVYSVYFDDPKRVSVRQSREFDSNVVSVPIQARLKLKSAPLPHPIGLLKAARMVGKIDVIHFHHPNPSMHPVLFLLRLMNPTASVVVHYHSDIEKQRVLRKFYHPFLSSLLNAASAIIATSPNYLRSSKLLRKYHKKVSVVPFGIEPRPRHNSKGSLAGPIRILSCGRFVEYKGFDILLRSFAQLRDLENVRLTVIGDGPLMGRYRELVADLKLKEFVSLPGFLNQEEMIKDYERADIFVLPSVSRTEAFGLALLEAMAFGLPTITTAIGTGTEYLVEKDFNGLVVEPRDPRALANAIQKLIDEPELRSKMGKRSLQLVENRFSKQKHYLDLESLYLNLVNRSDQIRASAFH